MSKARTLADFISDGSEFADGTISVAEVSGAAPLASPTFTGTVNVTTLDASSYVYTDHLIVRPDAPNYIQLDGSYPDGTWNTALGERAGDAWATGSNNNVAIGYASLSNSGTADYNTAVGAISLGSLYGSTAQHNTGIGSEAGKGITTGISNTAIGSASMANFSANLTGNYNVGVGRLSSYSNTSGSFNVAIGTEALRENETGESNTAVGYTAGYNSTGTSNTFIGSNRQYLKGAGYDMTTGDKNVIIGPFSGNSGGLDIRTSDNNIVLADGDGTPRLHIDSSGNADITGSTATTNVNLDAIAATISDTAVDIFVYDTRKDSDGGAWRKRTQHTSWYNETLNTATRGSRKEFPAVAVIVADSDSVTIYDGDDPDLPMWMVFNTNLSSCWFNTTTSFSLFAKNGILAAGGNDTNQRLRLAFFLKDHCEDYATPNSGGGHRASTGNFLDRNSQNATGRTIDSTIGIVDRTINDVAMTVLPSAPIDAATGLPVPTIAVATNGGVSVIKDDGTVVDVLTSVGQISEVSYNEDAYLWVTGGGGVAWSNWLFETNPTSDGQSPDFTFNSGSIPTRFGSNGGYSINKQDQLHETVAFGKTNTNSGPAVHLLNDTSMVAFIDPSYNTGWMNGDIKLATLSDTDATNVTGSELVTNGDFATNSDWTLESGWTISGGTLNGGPSGNDAYQTITCVVGETYVVSYEVTSYTSGQVFVKITQGANQDTTAPRAQSVGSYSYQFVAQTTSVVIAFDGIGAAPFAGSIDNVSVRLAEEDRSVNGNGLQVFGTVTKSAVATGADLVAYSGFSTSGNYLLQPYNSDLDFGTGDFSVTWWMKSGSFSYYDVMARQGTTAVDGGWLVQATPSHMTWYVYASGWKSTYRAVVDADNNIWQQYSFVRRNGKVSFYVNGLYVADTLGTSPNNQDDSMTPSTPIPLSIGRRMDENVWALSNGSIALTRISATAPSPEQIKKIYEDEKVLFQDGAQATLYGSSDAVTALAYDDSTNLLHVGTSAGRSVFQGLRRVDNTTTAVGAAISASNGLVADE